MNKKFAPKVFRTFILFAFVMGTFWIPGRSVGAQKPESDNTLNGKPSNLYLPELTNELAIITNIPVESMPTGVSVNPTTNRIYVANHGSNTVSVIDGDTNSVIATVPIGDGPHGISINPNTNRIYVANHGSWPWGTTVSVIDGDTNTVIATVPVGVRPVGVAVNPNTNRIYVTNFESNTLSVIDGITNTVSAIVAVGSGPHGVAVNPITNRIYVGIYWGSSVDVIDGDTNAVVASIPVGSPVAGIAVNPVTSHIYATNHHSTTVAVVDGTTNTMIDWVEVGSQPHGIAVNSNTNSIYVANYASSDVAVIDGITNIVTDTISVGGIAVGAGVNPNTDRTYIAVHSQNMVSVIMSTVPQNQTPVADAGGPYTLDWGATLPLDGSASTDLDNNIVSYEWDLDDDGEYDDAIGVTTVTSFTKVGEHTIGLCVTDEGGLSDTDTTTVTVLPWTLTGFYRPVDMNGVYNLVKGGSTVPLKFEIFAGSSELTDVSYIKSLTYAQTTCDATAITDEIETITIGDTSLRYDPVDGHFIYNWKTPKTAGKCYRVTVTTIDGSTLVAYFKLK